MNMMIRKATRKKAKLRLALLGPTGSGKTMSALKLAFGIGGKVGVVDTENGSADLYAHLGDYDVITLDKPYTVRKYRDAISAFEREGYTTIIVDSLSHAWSGAGGLLDKQGQMAAKPGANSYAAWREVTPDHNALVEALLTSPAHIVATMRVKTEYVLETNERGKQVPRKVGMAPVQRDGMEYEFTVVMDVDANHKASASKDRTTLFEGWYDVIDEGTGRKMLEWLEAGEAPPPSPRDDGPGSPWIVVSSADGTAKDCGSRDEFEKEWRVRISAVEASKKAVPERRSKLEEMLKANQQAFSALAAAGHTVAVSLVTGAAAKADSRLAEIAHA